MHKKSILKKCSSRFFVISDDNLLNISVVLRRQVCSVELIMFDYCIFMLFKFMCFSFFR